MASSLNEDLANALPEGFNFTIHHVSTPPVRCDPIYSPPPSGKIERTYCESHFLQVSIRKSPDSSDDIFIVAMECLIYTTKRLTTIFVSKADSTGYLVLLSLPKLHESPLRTIATTFISYLVQNRVRPGIKLVVDLFARASDQYLYPGSVENPTKHVSDDRQLVKWWCRVLNPLLLSYAARPPKPPPLFSSNPTPPASQSTPSTATAATATTAQAYLIVPGEDSITSFLPSSARYDSALRSRWTPGHPLRDLLTSPSGGPTLLLPPRCLIPHFPDDPKGRFVNELDAELPDSGVMAGSMKSGVDSASGMVAAIKAGEVMDGAVKSPSKRGNGEWRSVRSLEQFWEMMAFRSECSSGRLVGFIWIVVEMPVESSSSGGVGLNESQSSVSETLSPPKKKKEKNLKTANGDNSKSKLTGPIIPRLPRIKSNNTTSIDVHSIPKISPYYLWPSNSRGQLVFSRKQYHKALELLLRLDFAELRLGVQATRSWVDEVGVLGGGDGSWGERVTGRMKARETTESSARHEEHGGASVTTLNVMSVKRKAKGGGANIGEAEAKKMKTEETTATESSANQVNVLGGVMIRKKPKKVQPTPVTSE
jgi:regulator of Ty1 transposition protein 109